MTISGDYDLAWHFLRVNGVPVLRDCKTPAPAIGEWLEHQGDISICNSGLHASRRLIDALRFYDWENGKACLVEVDEVQEEQDDKLACRRRRIVAILDCDELLRTFARQHALSVIHLWEAPAVVKEFLETGNEDIQDATMVAAWAAAIDAASAATWDATRAAASAATRDAANDMLESMFLTEIGDQL